MMTKQNFKYLAPFSEESIQDSNPWRDARAVEEARLESVYTPKVYRGFESRSLRLNHENEIINN